MGIVGVCVDPARGRPVARVVVLDGDWDTPVEAQRFELTSQTDDLPTIFYELASGFRSHLSGLQVQRVVIRQADFFKIASNAVGPRVRLMAEGAIAEAARNEVSDVLLLPGKDLAARSPASSKAALDTKASAFISGSYSDAAAAALSGLVG